MGQNELIELYGSNVFNDDVMRERLPKDVYESLKLTGREGRPLDPKIADQVAEAMKNWAMEKGATHYTHWFQPMNNITAGKHDSFLTPIGDGHITLEFTGKALVKGEPDASSFPSGGLRATFEARGYTMWDPTSPAFVRENTLYIPTAFCAYTGEALDMKTPLLRSMQALSSQSLRVLRQLGNTTSHRVSATVGAEQEYFIVDRKLYEQRLDLKICGRTLFGAKPSKGQELDDHYCGRIRLRVAEFMEEMDRELWSLGVAAKTEHNEVAPAQHELAPVFESANIACDTNQLTMEVMRHVAKQHGLACLLHEKPFDRINGSGKHNNWGLSTDDGINLLRPGKHPEQNTVFLLFLCAVVGAVHEYGDLLRFSAATPGNDRRLGGYEAPPAVISINLGDSLTKILYDVAQGRETGSLAVEPLQMGVETLPDLLRDDSDRNRTSPFAFTGNKFEFRMVGSSQSIAMANVVLNTAVADVLKGFADKLEAAADKNAAVRELIAQTVQEHSAIIFNGNNYSDEWLEEAQKRGLPNLRDTVEAANSLISQKNMDLFQRMGVFTPTECRARHDIALENYGKVLSIEACTMLEMAKRQIFPACIRYAGEVASAYNAIGSAMVHASPVRSHLNELSDLIGEMRTLISRLEQQEQDSHQIGDTAQRAAFIRDQVIPAMEALRAVCDKAETIVDKERWPMPTYTDLLHRV